MVQQISHNISGWLLISEANFFVTGLMFPLILKTISGLLSFH